MEDAARKRAVARARFADEFVMRMHARRPEALAETAALSKKLTKERVADVTGHELRRLEAAQVVGIDPEREFVLETIVRRERPVLFVQKDWLNTTDVFADGEEAKALIKDLSAGESIIKPLMPLIGRIDVVNFAGLDFVGSGWLVAPDVIVTNRHVASLIARWDGRQYAFNQGIGGKRLEGAFNCRREAGDEDDNQRSFAITEVLYIEPESGRYDIAFLRVKRSSDGSKPDRILIADSNASADTKVVVIGYPARAPSNIIPDQQLMEQLFRGRYNIKRAAPGFTMTDEAGSTRHDCATLGGNSGSTVIDLKTGRAVGLHYAGLYAEANYAVRASVLNDYIKREIWKQPRQEVRTDTARPPPPPHTPSVDLQTPDGQNISVTIPLTITVSLGQPVLPNSVGASVGAIGVSGVPNTRNAEAAAVAFWDARPEGVTGVRVGYHSHGDRIGEAPFIAVSAPASSLGRIAGEGPAQFQGFDVLYAAADVGEQLEARLLLESSSTVSYDDDARQKKRFSFEPVEQNMTILAHVGPEYSWDQLEAFLSGAKSSLVSGIYEFHGTHIADCLEARLKDDVSLKLVMDNATFIQVKDEDEEFDRGERFAKWDKLNFERIVAPEGGAGLISDSYHIKVTVREDDTFWLSSGNWKMGSSQPPITQEQRDDAANTDLPGNREWHVIVKNRTLASRFSAHIEQDFERSEELGAGPVPKSWESAEIWVDVPIEEARTYRPPPRAILEPREFKGTYKVQPLLTPDQQGAIYSEAVLELIKSAKKSLLFQIPYIGMPSNPREDRGYIDALIKALTQKLKTLDDARLLLRDQGNAYSSPTNTAWYLKTKGVDIGDRVRQITNHHTKGMIVDGQRVLLGSHNWSKPGVTLNRDASLIIHDGDISAYYAEAFEIDWDRARPITPKRYVKPEGVLEAVGDAPPPGFERVRLSELLSDD